MAQGVAVSGGIGVPVSQTDPAAFASSYDPPFLYGTESSGVGGQALALERSWRPAFWGGLEWFPVTHAGILVRGLFQRTSFGGSNTPYEVSVDYLARKPPDYVRREYHYERSTPWPDTAGDLRTWAFDLEATWSSARSGARVHADGGLSFVGVSGSLAPVGLTTFQLGGHGVLFPNEYQVTLGLTRTWTIAGVIGGGFSLPIGRGIDVDISGRALLPRTIAADLHATEIGGDVLIAPLTTGDADRILSPAPLEIKLGTFSVMAGVKVRL